MKRCFRWASFWLLVLALGKVQATPTAEEVVMTTTDQVLARIEAEQATLNAHPEQVYDLVNELIIPHFDFVKISKYVLGRYWRTASVDQKKAFIAEFRTFLVRVYATTLFEYSGQTIKYLPAHNDPNSKTVIVKTEIEQPGAQSIPIDYRMYLKKDAWKVYDIAVSGISLVTTYRSAFASDINRDGLDTLIANLAQRNSVASAGGSP